MAIANDPTNLANMTHYELGGSSLSQIHPSAAGPNDTGDVKTRRPRDLPNQAAPESWSSQAECCPPPPPRAGHAATVVPPVCLDDGSSEGICLYNLDVHP